MRYSAMELNSPGSIKSVVVFTGDAACTTEVADGAFTSAGLVEDIRNTTAAVIPRNRVHVCVGRLETARLAISVRRMLNT
jgi:hypothetical protein